MMTRPLLLDALADAAEREAMNHLFTSIKD